VNTTTVTTGSRLHFGFLSLPGPDTGNAGASERVFGGAGLMIENPGTRVAVHRATEWSATGPLAPRALAFARYMDPTGNYRIVVDRSAPEHAGLGTGTQLGLAVARAVTLLRGRRDVSPVALAQVLGRGQRSGLGIHGFEHGGLLVDGGKGPRTVVAPLVLRTDFPEDWRIVLVLPHGRQGLHGQIEAEAFASLTRTSGANHGESMCRLVLMGLLPALRERDLQAFGQALYEFNRKTGEIFREWQAGVYASGEAGELVSFLRAQGHSGVGQSSWGPALFAVSDAEQAEDTCARLRRRFGFNHEEVLVTRAAKQGASVCEQTAES
jgi:beta-ribofuranosylaminobenzene 5'-phosphate synthase